MATSFHVWEEVSIPRIYIALKLALLQPGIVQIEKVKGAKTSAGMDRQGGEGKKNKLPRLEMQGRGGRLAGRVSGRYLHKG